MDFGFTKEQSQAYGNLEYNGTFEKTSLIRRTDETRNTLGLVTDYIEETADSSMPDLINIKNVSGITYDSFGRKKGQTSIIESKGTYTNPITKEQEIYDSKQEVIIEDKKNIN